MIKTIKFKQEFEEKLKGNKRRFLKNVRKEEGSYEDFVEYAEWLNSENSFRDFISAGFLWSDTPEGHLFWKKISML